MAVGYIFRFSIQSVICDAVIGCCSPVIDIPEAFRCTLSLCVQFL